LHVTTENLPTLGLTSLGLVGLVLAVLQLCRRDTRLTERVKAFGPVSTNASEGAIGAPTANPQLQSAARQLAGWLLPRGEAQRTKLRMMLVHAGYYAPSALMWYVVGQFCLAAALLVIAGWLCRFTHLGWGDQLICAAVAGCTAYLLPCLWLRRRKAERHRILNRSLPDLLDLMVTCLDAGLSLEAVIQRVAQETGFTHELLADELRRVQREIELGAPPDRALQSFAERTDAEVVRSLATVCQQSRKYGARVSEALRTHADMLRDQREQTAEEAAQKASVKILFPTLLCLFPAIFVVLAGPAAIQIAENFTGQQAQAEAAQSSPK
jgi:tight adherence protein C